MGDIIHTLPAVTDAASAVPNVQFDWVVEEAFTEIPKWHNQVQGIIPIALRRWRKNIWQIQNGEIKRFYTQLRAKEYDFVLDAQGSIKSAITAGLSRGYRLGMNRDSVRESIAYLAYQKTFSVSWQQHAINRLRLLFSQALNYSLPVTPPNYGIDKKNFNQTKIELPKNYLLFIPNTSCSTKRWSHQAWSSLLLKITQQGFSVYIPWGNENERINANRLTNNNPLAQVLPYLSLSEMAAVLVNAKAVVTVDTGLSHLSAAFGVPTIVLYGPTNPLLIGTIGASQLHIRMVANENSKHETDSIILKEITENLQYFLTL